MVNAAFRTGNVFATQFHPEKSGRDGLALLANFVAGVGAVAR
jgi:glutamine amidotransferase